MKIPYSSISIKKQELIEAGSIELTMNSLTVLCGENGSGKSLLLKQLYFSLVNDGYNVVIIDQSSEHIIKSKTILENIAISYKKEELMRAKKMLISFNLVHLISHKSSELSGGEKRMISILRGLFLESDIILIDEPTNELDFESVEKLKYFFKQVAEEKVILCISHDDRIIDIADKVYKINSKKLNQINGNLHHNNESLDKNKRQNFDSNFVKNLFAKRWATYILVIIFLATTIFTINYLRDNLQAKVPEMEADQVEIFIPTATLSTDIHDGALPIAYFAYIVGNESYSEMLDAYQRAYQNHNNKGLTFGLRMPDSLNYENYVIELYDVSKNENYLLPEIYMNNMFNASIYEDIFISKQYFVLSKNPRQENYDYTPQEVYLDIDDYKQIEASIYNSDANDSDNIKNAHIILVMNEGYNFYDFLTSDAFTDISNGNYFIRSNESIQVYNTIESFKIIKSIIYILGSVSIFILLMDILLSLLYMKVRKTNIKILVNRGWLYSDLKKVSSYKYKITYFRIFITIFLIGYYYLTRISSIDHSVQKLIILYFFIIMIVQEVITRLIFLRNLKSHYHWRYR